MVAGKYLTHDQEEVLKSSTHDTTASRPLNDSAEQSCFVAFLDPSSRLFGHERPMTNVQQIITHPWRTISMSSSTHWVGWLAFSWPGPLFSRSFGSRGRCRSG